MSTNVVTNPITWNDVYPVGSYYETSDSSFDPNNNFGGTWELETEGLVHIGAGSTYAIGATGGEKTHLLTGRESGIQYHRHSIGNHAVAFNSVTPGGNQGFCNYFTTGYTDYTGHTNTLDAHNNMQPYIVVNRWHRVA